MLRAALVLVLLGATPAAADSEPVLGGDSDAAGSEPAGAEPTLITPTRGALAPSLMRSHKGQFQASARLALGLRAIATYEDTAYCGDTDSSAARGFAPVCTGRAPFSVDFELGYGITSRIDAFLEIRLGIEPDFGTSTTADDGPRAFHLSPGARFFVNESSRMKLFTTAQLLLDLTGYDDPTTGKGRGTDIGLRNLSGLWFDLDEAYGVYVFIGETASFARWLRFELEAGVGIQGRYR